MNDDYKSYIEELAKEQELTAENMNKDERDYYFYLLSNCKDIIDTVNKIGNCCTGNIVQLHFLKESDEKINFDGAVTYHDPNSTLRENRWISGTIKVSKDSFKILTNVERIKYLGQFKSYTVIDEFTLVNGKVYKKSRYSNNLDKDYSNEIAIEWRTMRQ